MNQIDTCSTRKGHIPQAVQQGMHMVKISFGVGVSISALVIIETPAFMYDDSTAATRVE